MKGCTTYKWGVQHTSL